MGMDVGGHKGGVKSDINVTPLVDIVLVLLIIFIVITPAVNNSVKLPLAKHTPKVVKNPGYKYMTIIFAAKRDGDGKYLAPGLISVTETSGTGGEEPTESSATGIAQGGGQQQGTGGEGGASSSSSSAAGGASPGAANAIAIRAADLPSGGGGGDNGSTTTPDPAKGTYTVTLTAQDSPSSAIPAATTTFTIVIQ